MQQSVYCSSCGSQLASAARFCPRCGHPVEAQSGTPVPAPVIHTPTPLRQSSTNLGALIGGAIVVLIILFAALNAASRVSTTALLTHGSSSSLPVFQDPMASSCSPSDFKIKEHTGTVEYGYLTVVGVVHNSCSQAAGVEMELDQYSASGKLLDTDRSWPASVSNIAPHEDFNFKLMQPVPDGAVKYSVAPDDVKHW